VLAHGGPLAWRFPDGRNLYRARSGAPARKGVQLRVRIRRTRRFVAQEQRET